MKINVAWLAVLAVFCLNSVTSVAQEECISAVGTTSATEHGGTALINADQTITYTPAPGFVGVDTFDYIICDGRGGFDTGTVTVTVEPPINNNPIALNDSATTREGQPVAIDALGNDSDPDGDTLIIQEVRPGVGGTTMIESGGSIVYIPNAGFTGSDSFEYFVTDGRGGFDMASVFVNVKKGKGNTGGGTKCHPKRGCPG